MIVQGEENRKADAYNGLRFSHIKEMQPIEI